MKINFKATNIELNEQLYSYTIDKLSAVEKLVMTDRTGDDGLAEVELGRISEHHKHGEVYRAEVNLHSSGRYFRSEATAGDLYAAIDGVKDELLREIKTWRKKQGTLFRRGARAVKNLLRGIYHR